MKKIYCDKILMALLMGDKKTRFNELHRRLIKYGAKISKPTLIKHLNHLIKNEIIQRNEEDKQKVSYGLNWKRFKQLQKAEKINETALHLIKNEEGFKSETLGFQATFAAIMLSISDLFYLKLTMLNILEPENKLQNYFAYTLIRRLYSLYATWLFDSCKDSKENAQKTIHSIDKFIKALQEKFLEIPPEATQQKPENIVGIFREF